MKKIAIIVAGGTGTRMGSALPKQFLLLKNKPILWHTLNTFTKCLNGEIELIVVSHKDYFSLTEEVVQQLAKNTNVQIVAGGETRFDSVKNGLALVKEPAIIFVHDAVRCLVTKEMIEACYEQAVAVGSAVPAVPATDSIRIIDGNNSKVADRNTIRIVQTPQTFSSSILLPAFEQSYVPAFTDEATVVEAYGKDITLIEGDFNNIKITRPADIVLAEQLLASL